MHQFKDIPGLNIQFPWSQKILSGDKVVETRTYPIPKKYIGSELAVIETAGPHKEISSKIVGTVIFESCFKYDSKNSWIADFERHLVNIDDPNFGWTEKKEKWGWVVKHAQLLSHPLPPPRRRGIVFARHCRILKPT